MWRVAFTKLKRRALPAMFILAIVTLLAGWVWLWHFDLNRYKPELQDRVREKLGRELILVGDIALSWSPLGVKVANAQLADVAPNTAQTFVSIGQMRFELDVRAYLKDRLVRVTRAELRDVDVYLRVDHAGALNIDDLLANPPPRLALPAEAEGILVERAQIHLQRPGREPLQLDIARADIGRVQLQQPISIVVSGALKGDLGGASGGAMTANTPAAVPFVLKSSLTLDADGDQFVVGDMNLALPKVGDFHTAELSIGRLVHRRKGAGTTARDIKVLAQSTSAWRGPIHVNVGQLDWRNDEADVANASFRATLATADAHRVAVSVQSDQLRYRTDPPREAGRTLRGELRGTLEFVHGGRALTSDWRGKLAADSVVRVSDFVGHARFTHSTAQADARIMQGEISYARETARVTTRLPLTALGSEATLGKHELIGLLLATHDPAGIRASLKGTLDGAALDARVDRVDGAPAAIDIALARLDLARWQGASQKPKPSDLSLPFERWASQVQGVMALLESPPVRGAVAIGEIVDSREPNGLRAKGVKLEFE